MKHYHVNFNKKSRLARAPEIAAASASQLLAMDPKQLKFRISAALQIQNDYFPCFDRTFPPPVAQKARGTIEAEKLFWHPSAVPGLYPLALCTDQCGRDPERHH